MFSFHFTVRINSKSFPSAVRSVLKPTQNFFIANSVNTYRIHNAYISQSHAAIDY